MSYESFITIFVEEFGFSEAFLKKETKLIEDLGIDSLSLVNFIIKLKKEYGIEYVNNEGIRFDSLYEFYNCLARKY